MIISEIAFSLVLLAGAALLLRSFVRLLNVDKGFYTDHILTMGIWPSAVRYADPKLEINYLQQMQERISTVPGVRSAGFITDLPLSGGSTDGSISIEGQPRDHKHPLNAQKQFVGGNYFQPLRVPLLKQRYMPDANNPPAPPVVIINQTFARQFFPNKNPIANHIDFVWGNPGFTDIVGVA